MDRRKFLSAVGAAGMIGTAPGLAAARRRKHDRNRGEEQLIDVSVIESQERYQTGKISTDEGEYAYYVDKSEGTVSVERVDADVSGDNRGEVKAQGITGDLIITDSNDFNKKIGSCSLDSSCIHMFSGGSSKVNKYLAGASKAVIIGAAIAKIAARIPITAIRNGISIRSVSSALSGAVAADFGGNWVTLAGHDHDQDGTKKKATGVALTRTKDVSPSQMRSIDFDSGNHWGCEFQDSLQ